MPNYLKMPKKSQVLVDRRNGPTPAAVTYSICASGKSTRPRAIGRSGSAAAATRPRAWRARSAWPATWPLSSASIRIRTTRPPAASIRAYAAYAARYTATSCRISAVLTAPLNTRWLARPSVAHSPAARAAPAGVATTTVKRSPCGPGAVWRSIHPRCSVSPIPRRPANVWPSNWCVIRSASATTRNAATPRTTPSTRSEKSRRGCVASDSRRWPWRSGSRSRPAS